MQVSAGGIEGLLLIDPVVHADERGWFHEAYNERDLAPFGIRERFVQDNLSHSRRGVLRGLHYQVTRPQGKLVRVLRGEIYDVAVDLRRDASSFGRWSATRLSAENRRMKWIPPGFAHGFLVVADEALVLYKTTDYRYPEHERRIAWDDPRLAIDWPLQGAPVLSPADAAAGAFDDTGA